MIKPYQLLYQQQLPREQYIPPSQQRMPTYVVPAANMTMLPSVMPDNSAMLRAAPYMPYMANTSAVQHPIQQPAIFQAAAKQSKAIKIVNPETMKEVDISNLKTTSLSSSSSHSTPKPTTETELQTVDTAADSKDNEVCYITRQTSHSNMCTYKIPHHIFMLNVIQCLFS